MNKNYDKCPYKEENCDLSKCACAKYLAYEAVNDPEQIKEELAVMGFDIENMSIFELLMSMQKLFAGNFHKVDNLTKSEQDKWINAYLVCVEDEIREVREHLGIYPGKANKTNVVELKKEIIDILHFMMDEFICGNATYKDIEKAYLKEFFPDIACVSDLIEFSYKYQNSVSDRFDAYNYDHSCLLLVNELLDCSAMVRQCISWKHWKKPAETIDYDKLYRAFAHTFRTFIDLCKYNDMRPNDIKDIYIKKNLENRFRQKIGY